ncbi:MAG: phospho-N-acetylmuramoyl-pentapeptide-transferase [Lachnospiraceae bacterium]|nr:phospho-N-acetylmuramoyl-pentapeptide-transferase [Lachnospiraceae bacterium]
MLDKSFIFSTIVAFGISALLGPLMIPVLTRLKIGQTVRTEGPESHLKKNGTPTMGGILILGGFFVSLALYFILTFVTGNGARGHEEIVPVMILTIGFGLVGFIDDYIKVVRKQSEGLKAWQKMGLQIIVTTAFLMYMLTISKSSLESLIPFTGGSTVDIGWIAIPLLYFVVLGTDTGANFTDGLDGLATSVTMVITLFFAMAGATLGVEVGYIAGAMFGGLMGFLLFNAYPAKVFMGDTGALALGGFVAGMAYVLKMPIILVIVAFIYVAEVLSVILQVGYFKITKGKRLFKMAPIHHHFEKCGMKETKVVALFTIVTICCCLIAYLAL